MYCYYRTLDDGVPPADGKEAGRQWVNFLAVRRELLSPPSVVGSIETQRFSKSPSIAEMGIKTIFNYIYEVYITLLVLTSDLKPQKLASSC